MLNFSNVWGKISNNKLLSSFAENYNKLKDTINGKFNIIEIVPRLYHIDYPQTHYVQILAEHIAGDAYQILNLSQYSYQPQLRGKIVNAAKGEILHLCFQFYPSSPFYELLSALDKIQEFLRTKPNAKMYIHCQQSKIRSAVFLSCYLLKHKCEGISCISEAIIKVNKHLGICLEQKNVMQGKGKYANHHLLIRNFINYQTNPQFINEYELQLRKIVLHNPPWVLRQNRKGQAQTWQQAKVYAQLRCGKDMAWKGWAQSEKGQLKWTLKAKVSDEFLIVIKYMVDKEVYRMMRVQLNSNFIFQQNATIQENNIDLSPYVKTQKGVIQISLNFIKLPGKSKLAAKTSEINSKKAIMDEGKSKAIAEQVNQSNFALESHQQTNNGQTDLQVRIDQLMRNIAERQLQKEEEDKEDEEGKEGKEEEEGQEEEEGWEADEFVQQNQEKSSQDNKFIKTVTKQETKIEESPTEAKDQTTEKVQIKVAKQLQDQLSDQDFQAYMQKLESQAI